MLEWQRVPAAEVEQSAARAVASEFVLGSSTYTFDQIWREKSLEIILFSLSLDFFYSLVHVPYSIERDSSLVYIYL